MEKTQHIYVAIDLKSFYASIECVERNLDPLDTCLVVADESRTEKTICLAVSPPLKAYGIGGRPRLFEVTQKVRQLNYTRGHKDRSFLKSELDRKPSTAIDYIVAPPRMQLYIDYSSRIYEIYLKYIAPEDIHVYSIDEVFIDVTAYLFTHKTSAHELTARIIGDILTETGITATAGIGTNLYLCKVAMDILAKKQRPDANGARIALLDEASYRKTLWTHTPLSDFWRIGSNIMNRLNAAGIYTMGDIARCSIENESWLYTQFGVNAELIIDHAWGYEPVTMDMIKKYRPSSQSIACGQVLSQAYDYAKARNVIREMAHEATLRLVEQHLLSDRIVLTIGYDSSNTDPLHGIYTGRTTTDRYGRNIPYHAHGTSTMPQHSSSSQTITHTATELFDRIADPRLLIRRISLSLCHLIHDSQVIKPHRYTQLDLFTDYEELKRRKQAENRRLQREYICLSTIIDIRRRFGKNSILMGFNFADGATQRERNMQIGGHKA